MKVLMAVVTENASADRAEKEDPINSNRKFDRRHYKKDTRFILDLYTLTYDSHENVDSLGDLSNKRNANEENQQRNVWQKNNINLRNNKNAAAAAAASGFGNRFRKPSLQSRLQNGRNLQLCFVNEETWDVEDSATNNENGVYSLPVITQYLRSRVNTRNVFDTVGDETVSLTPDLLGNSTLAPPPPLRYKNRNLNNAYDDNNNNNIIPSNEKWSASEFREEMCTALNNVYNETHRRLELERCRRSTSPITCTIKTSLKKVGVEPKEGYRGRQRVNRHMLTKMNAVQLQSIINDLHTHVEYLNEQLVQMLMERDELHMSRDSLLVDIEDLTAHLEAKQVYTKDRTIFHIARKNYKENSGNNNCTTKNLISGMRFNRLASYIKN